MRFILMVFIGIFLVAIVAASSASRNSHTNAVSQDDVRFWQVQSIDTVKYSRDIARQEADDPTFDKKIDDLVSKIAGTGATHISIATPYDEEFIPFLTKWVNAARTHGLKVWFRGNFSGWEKWFNYDQIDRNTHKKLLDNFYSKHMNLFADGDIFTSCTECENGGPGDPRKTGDVSGFRQFLIDEYKIGKEAFRNGGKNVATNYYPMNGDVVWLVMDQDTTQALGGLAVVDHYVSTPEILVNGLNDIVKKTGGKVVLGEFGAPIPDIHGNLTEQQQAEWISESLRKLASNPDIIGVNYWTGIGGTTQLWNDDGSERMAVSTLKSYYSPSIFSGQVVDDRGYPVSASVVSLPESSTLTDSDGMFAIGFVGNTVKATVSKDGYKTLSITSQGNNKIEKKITITRTNQNILYKIQVLFNKILS